MTLLSQSVIKNVVRNLIMSKINYRIEIVNLINAKFLDFTVSFFKEVAQAKLDNKKIGIDWYKERFIDDSMDKSDIATNAGINLKTIGNIHGTQRKAVVIDAANKNYESVQELIKNLVDSGEGVGVTITIKFNNVSVDLDINESLIVINAIAVKRATMRGGMWSSVGKRAEKPLMLTLCHLFSVARENYDVVQKEEDSNVAYEREVDFFLVSDKRHKCEVKLMGKGNPESADAVIARGSKVFVADTLSKSNMKDMDSRQVEWVCLRRDNERDNGYRRFETVLKNLSIPYKNYTGDINANIDRIIDRAFSGDS